MSSDRSAVEQSVEFAFKAMQAGAQIATSRKEQEMNEAKLGWFDRLLIKIALAKATARGHCPDSTAKWALSGFARINEASSRTSQSGDRAAQQ